MQKLAILHLSDIHIKSGKNPIIPRIGQIVSAMSAYAHEVDKVLLVISGDIAFSGSHEEYKIASEFIQKLEEEFGKISTLLIPDYVIVPGNHDCSFAEHNSIRDMFMSNTSRNREHLGGDMLSACLKAQANYEKFRASLKSGGDLADGKLFSSRIVEIDDRKLLINTCNTAWLSKLHEQQGTIFIPANFIQVKPESETDACLTVFHHPYNWFEAINAREFRSSVEEFSDLILTGHEHEGGSFRRTTGESESNDYIEGHALQDSSDRENSGFNVVILDFKDRSLKICRYQWKEDYYGMDGSPELRQFSNHSRVLIGAFDPSKAFSRY